MTESQKTALEPIGHFKFDPIVVKPTVKLAEWLESARGEFTLKQLARLIRDDGDFAMADVA